MPAPSSTATAKAKTPTPTLNLADAMRELEQAGTAQARKIYARHGAPEPMFGVSFAFMKTLVKRIKVDHGLARQLWGTGNYDARTLAAKIADPQQMTPAELDEWADASVGRTCCSYVAMLAVEGPHGPAKAAQWLASSDAHRRAIGWALVGQLATHDVAAPDAQFAAHLQTIEATIHAAPNDECEVMNQTVIQIGCRNPTLRQLATAAAQRIGKVHVDYGDTDCKTPDAASYIAKSWDYALAKGAPSPAAQERAREPQRTRC